MILFAALLGGFGTVGFWLYQPYFQLCRVPLVYFGFIFALFHLFAGLARKTAFAVERALGKRAALATLPTALGISFAAMAIVVHPAGFVLVLLAQFGRGFTTPVIQDYINRHTWSDKRATVLSLKNLMSRVVFVAVAPAVGAIVDHAGVRFGLVAAAGVIIVMGGVLLLALRRDRVI